MKWEITRMSRFLPERGARVGLDLRGREGQNEGDPLRPGREYYGNVKRLNTPRLTSVNYPVNVAPIPKRSKFNRVVYLTTFYLTYIWVSGVK